MNCKILQSQLDDFLDGELNPAQAGQIQEHLASCDGCHQLWQQEIQFRQLLQEHPVPAPEAGFEDRVFAKLPRQQASSTHKKAFYAGFGGAIAAGVMLMVAAAIFIKPVSQQELIPNITLTMHESKKVNMVFDVPDVVADATFSLQVPGHIEIAGRTGLHQIEWKTALKKGKNLLSLPIVAKGLESGELVAKIKYGDQVKTFRMKLDIHSVEQGSLETVILEAV